MFNFVKAILGSVNRGKNALKPSRKIQKVIKNIANNEISKTKIKDIPQNNSLFLAGKSGTGKFSVTDSLSQYVGQTEHNLRAQFDKILKEAKAEGKVKLDISEIAKYLEKEGMTAEKAKIRAELLSGLDKLKASGAVETYIPAEKVDINRIDPVILHRFI